MPRPLRQFAEVVCWTVGLAAFALYVVVAHEENGWRDGIAAFTGTYSAPDRSAWAHGRIDAFETSGSMPNTALHITRVNLDVPTYEVPTYTEYTERNLDFDTGLTDGIALPGSDGSIAVATHQDGYFRMLSEVLIGDAIEVGCAYAQDVYLDSELYLMDPTDTRPLSDAGTPVITLVTCYPFHSAESEPERYIAQAVWQLETAVAE